MTTTCPNNKCFMHGMREADSALKATLTSEPACTSGRKRDYCLQTMTDFSTKSIAVARSGSISASSLAVLAVSNVLSLPMWVNITAACCAALASLYAIRLSRINIKKADAELKYLRAKAEQHGIDLD